MGVGVSWLLYVVGFGHKRYVFFIVLLLMFFGCREAVAQSDSGILIEEQHPVSGAQWHWRSTKSCGVTSCYVLLRYHGLDLNYQQVADKIPVGPHGSFMADMATACEGFGVPVSCRHVTPTEFSKIPVPFIAHLERGMSIETETGGHFVVVVDASSEMKYVDPAESLEPVSMGSAEFLRCFSGNVLTIQPTNDSLVIALGCFVILVTIFVFLFLRTPRTGLTFLSVLLFAGCEGSDVSQVHDEAIRPKSTLLAFSTNVDLGVLEKGVGTATFRITNYSDSEASLNVGSPTCICTNASVSKKSLKPGESAMLSMTLSSRGKAGLLTANVVVSCDDPKWSEKFRVSGAAPGVMTPKDEIIVTKDRPGRIELTFISETSDTECSVSFKDMGGLFSCSEPVFSKRTVISGATLQVVSTQVKFGTKQTPALGRYNVLANIVHGSEKKEIPIHILALDD
ncbi:Peptidase C39 family protein [Gimesia panareensis]|nr:Peptidase C39 family protein [Gimesia panareensis]